MKRFAPLCSLLLVLSVLSGGSAFGQNSQSYLNDIGSTAYGINIPVENGFIDVSNGNLHMEFPLATHAQRGALSLNERLVYDSRIWNFLPFGTNGSYHWWPYNIPGNTTSSGGWQFVTGAEVGTVTYQAISTNQTPCGQTSPPGQPTQPSHGGLSGYVRYTISNILWTDHQGTTHVFNSAYSSTQDDCNPQNDLHSTFNTFANDASGYQVVGDLNGNVRIRSGDGTQVYPAIADRYGNSWSSDAQGNLIDDLGRTPVLVTQNGNVTYYDVLAPNGTIQNNGLRVRYTVTTAPISVATNFQQQDTYEWNPTAQDLNPVQSIQLPDGSKYTFGYDGYGGMNSMTLPTGGVILYGYSSFVDSSATYNRWLTSRQVGSNPATTFSPAVETTCVNYASGCKEFVIVQKPSTDSTVYELTLANGAWNTETFVYTGKIPSFSGISPRGSATIKSIVFTTTTYTYANPCSGSTCVGANNIKSALATTELFANGTPAVYTQTQTAFNPVSGKPTSSKTWDYAGCLVPAFDGACFSERVKEALWDRFYTGAPQRQRRSVERYNIVKRA